MSKENYHYIFNPEALNANFKPPSPNTPIETLSNPETLKKKLAEKNTYLIIIGGDTTFATTAANIASLALNRAPESQNQPVVLIPFPCGGQNNAAKIAGTTQNFPSHLTRPPDPEEIERFTEEYIENIPPLIPFKVLVVTTPQGENRISAWYIDITPENLTPLSKHVEDNINKSRRKGPGKSIARMMAIAKGYFEWLKELTRYLTENTPPTLPRHGKRIIQQTFLAYPFAAYGRAFFLGNQENSQIVTLAFPENIELYEALLRLNLEILAWQALGFIPPNFQCIKIECLKGPYSFTGNYNFHIDSLTSICLSYATITPESVPNLYMPVAR